MLLVLLPDAVDELHAADHVGHPVEALDAPERLLGRHRQLEIIAISVCGENASF